MGICSAKEVEVKSIEDEIDDLISDLDVQCRNYRINKQEGIAYNSSVAKLDDQIRELTVSKLYEIYPEVFDGDMGHDRWTNRVRDLRAKDGELKVLIAKMQGYEAKSKTAGESFDASKTKALELIEVIRVKIGQYEEEHGKGTQYIDDVKESVKVVTAPLREI